jgi:uncharacterized protein (DUF1697 family)
VPHNRTRYVALLRGINVGGSNLISMATLSSSFNRLGYAAVRTYLNSGNVLFQAEATDPGMLEVELQAALAPDFGEPIRVMVRSAGQMSETVTRMPASWRDQSDKKCNVIFLHHSIDSPELVGILTPKSDLEELHYAPGVLFWSAKLDGLTHSAMLKLSQLPVYQDMTVRGVRTTVQIHELLQA